jgi:Family of unknown function (DUF6252)
MNFRLSSWILLILALSFGSCTKEMSKENGSIPVSGNFYATIEGKTWDADSLQLIYASKGGVSIGGISKSGDQITIVIPVFKTGTYTFNATTDNYAYYANMLLAPTVGYLSNAGSAAGTLTISAIDTINHFVSGTFSFLLVNPVDNTSKSITGGVFDHIPYSGAGTTPPPVTGSLDTLNATVDGTPFQSVQIQGLNTAGQIVISGIATGGQGLDILVPNDIGPGTYSLTTIGTTSGFYYTTGSDPLISQTGTLEIISNDATTKIIKGTFNFSAKSLTSNSTASVTEGYFSVNYQ